MVLPGPAEPGLTLESLPGACKEATLGPILEPFPVDPKVDPRVASVNVQEYTHTHTHTQFQDSTPCKRNQGAT